MRITCTSFRCQTSNKRHRVEAKRKTSALIPLEILDVSAFLLLLLLLYSEGMLELFRLFLVNMQAEQQSLKVLKVANRQSVLTFLFL